MTATVSTPAIIPHSRPFFGREEIDAVTRVIQSRHIAQGEEVEQLEREWANATGNRGAVCVGSGLAALRLALHSVGVQRGSEVIVPAYSCIALFNAVLALGATPVLADVAVDRWTLDAKSVEKKRTARTAAIVVVHLFGMPADIDALRAFGVPIIEDCAHGIGGRVGSKPFGGSATASIGSFYATKMIAGGEGGVVASNDEKILNVVWTARNPSDQAPNALYLNDKLTDLEAAVVRAQLARLQWTLNERAARAARYTELLSPLAAQELIVLPSSTEGRIWYRYTVRLTSRRADNIARDLHAVGIHADQPVWDLRLVVDGSPELRGTATAFDRVLSLPLYPDLSPLEQERVCEALRDALLRQAKDVKR
jgi:perosamine synthetase